MKVNGKKLYSLKEVEKLNLDSIQELYQKHHNPGLTEIFQTLGFNKIKVTSARGNYYFTEDNQKILDLWGGYGCLNLGHNHPGILKARENFSQAQGVEICMAFYSPYVAALAANIANILPGDLNYVVLSNTGADAVEGALKLAEKYGGPRRDRLIYFNNSFHGKTHAALSVTSHQHPKKFYKMLWGCQEVTFGDANALESALAEFGGKKKCDVAAVIIEPIQGNGGIIPAPPGFLKTVRHLCDQYGALMIVDEVASGFGRSGRMFAFEYEDGLIPDLVTMAKSLGGGKTAISAMAVKEKIFKKAYGASSDSSLLSTTFAGMGEACVTAIETINLIYQENLVEAAEKQGKYFLDALKKLHHRYPKIIKDVRGRGLMIGLEFHNFGKILLPIVDPFTKLLGPSLNGAYTILTAIELLFQHNILVALTAARPNVIRLLPPLAITREQIDQVIDALDQVLNMGVIKLGLKTVKRKLFA